MFLRPYAEEDRALTAALESDPRVMAHLGGPGSASDADQVHAERLAGELYFTIMVADQPIGVIAVFRSDQQVYELGVLLLPEHQARGLAERAFRLILPHVRARGITHLHGFITDTNTVSAAAAMRVGFVPIGERDLHYRGATLRCVHLVLQV
jgi:RimJ/RimL family protein N-acetyltransferase